MILPVMKDLMDDLRNQPRPRILRPRGMCFGDLILGDCNTRVLEEELNEGDEAGEQEELDQDDGDDHIISWAHHTVVVETEWWTSPKLETLCFMSDVSKRNVAGASKG